MRARLGLLLVGSALVASAGFAPSDAVAAGFPGCLPDSSPVVVGTVTCQMMPSAFLGASAPFSYFVPPMCDPATDPVRRCPTLYLLHGFGGDYRSMLGTGAAPSAWVAALSSGPAGDPASGRSWTMSDPTTWVARDPIGFILVAPHGETLPGGYGPVAGVDGFWTDWNPRFARGGDAQAYDTPPPRFESFFIRELIPYVESHLPAGSGREWRALAGTSLGGFGSYKDGLQHPDLFSSIGSVSGAHNFLFAPAPDPVDIYDDASLAPPAPLPYLHLPSATSRVPLAALPEQIRGFAAALQVFGDPATDQAFYRGNMPRDLAMNARARATSPDAPSLYIRGFVNDAIPRRVEDVTDLRSYLTAQAFEAIVLPMNLEMDAAFTVAEVPHTFEIHPGIHSGVYWNAYLRTQIAEQYARVRHADGGGDPTPMPSVFDYRTISKDFEIWGWTFSVAREPVEFLTLRSVACDGFRIRGSGVVTVTVPASCGTGVNGSRTFSVDLGPSWPIDEPAGASALLPYGTSVSVRLTSL
jgi:S-formylglutathione hydrolase FrmB